MYTSINYEAAIALEKRDAKQTSYNHAKSNTSRTYAEIRTEAMPLDRGPARAPPAPLRAAHRGATAAATRRRRPPIAAPPGPSEVAVVSTAEPEPHRRAAEGTPPKRPAALSAPTDLRTVGALPDLLEETPQVDELEPLQLTRTTDQSYYEATEPPTLTRIARGNCSTASGQR